MTSLSTTIINKQALKQRNKYVGLLYCQAEMYAGRVACCPLVTHGKYADGTDKQTDRPTDARPLRYDCFPLDAANAINSYQQTSPQTKKQPQKLSVTMTSVCTGTA